MNLKDLENHIHNKLTSGELFQNLQNILIKYDDVDYKQYIKYSDITYQRNYVTSNDLFDIIIISWKAGQKSKIHDHPENGCIMTVLEGKLQECVYANHDSPVFLHCKYLSPKEVAYKKSNVILHDIKAITNTVSLHIYSPPKYITKIYN